MGKVVIMLAVTATAWFAARPVGPRGSIGGSGRRVARLVRADAQPDTAHADLHAPVASRTLGYVGVTAFEAVAGGSDQLQSLSGQLNGLDAVPQRVAGELR